MKRLSALTVSACLGVALAASSSTAAWASSSTPNVYTTVGLTQLVDTRTGVGGFTGVVPSGTTKTVSFTRLDSFPATQILAIEVTVTALNATGSGTIIVGRAPTALDQTAVELPNPSSSHISQSMTGTAIVPVTANSSGAGRLSYQLTGTMRASVVVNVQAVTAPGIDTIATTGDWIPDDEALANSTTGSGLPAGRLTSGTYVVSDTIASRYELAKSIDVTVTNPGSSAVTVGTDNGDNKAFFPAGRTTTVRLFTDVDYAGNFETAEFSLVVVAPAPGIDLRVDQVGRMSQVNAHQEQLLSPNPSDPSCTSAPISVAATSQVTVALVGSLCTTAPTSERDGVASEAQLNLDATGPGSGSLTIFGAGSSRPSVVDATLSSGAATASKTVYFGSSGAIKIWNGSGKSVTITINVVTYGYQTVG